MEQLQKIQKMLTEITVSTAALNSLVGRMLSTDFDTFSELLPVSTRILEKLVGNFEEVCNDIHDASVEIVRKEGLQWDE